MYKGILGKGKHWGIREFGNKNKGIREGKGNKNLGFWGFGMLGRDNVFFNRGEGLGFEGL